MRRGWTFGVAGLLTLGSLAGLRAALEPKESPAPVVDLSPAAQARMAGALAASRTGEAALLADLARAEVLLVGEEHRYRETLDYVTALLDRIEGRRLTLLLELPAGLQDAVDEFVSSGRSARFEAAVQQGKALPLQPILLWAHRNRGRLSGVRAMDENPARIFISRALLHDTRNATMAEAVKEARSAHPGDLVVAYGGQLHMILAGRYRYDRPDRTPAGARLAEAFGRTRIRSLLLSGRGKAAACASFEPGIVSMEGPAGALPFSCFIDEPVFRATRGGELFDYFVNLGALTRVR